MAKVGRPSDYKESFTKKADKYLLSYETLGEKVPTIQGFAEYIGVTKKTIYNWVQGEEPVASPEFLHALAKIEDKQAKTLINNGLSGKFNSSITKLMLSANHGMSEKSEIDHTSKGEALGVIMYPQKDESSLETTTEAGESPS